MTMKKCKQCGKEFTPKYPNQCFCNFFCRIEYSKTYRKKVYQARKKDPNYKKYTTCLNCEKPLTGSGYKKYCSTDCMREYRNKERRKMKHEPLTKVVPTYKKAKTTYSIGGFKIKLIKDDIGYHWDAYKLTNRVLQSAQSFISLEGCLRDAKKAFRG